LHETNKFIIVKPLNYLFPHKFQRNGRFEKEYFLLPDDANIINK